MTGRFALGNAVVVTTGTGTTHFSVVYGDCRRPERVAVASLALVAAGDVVPRLAGSRSTVMAAGTISRNSRMIEIGRRPCSGGVAIVTTVTAGYMITGFAQRDGVVVTAATGTAHFTMVHPDCRRPGAGTMTGVAAIAAEDMCERFSLCNTAVMTTGAAARDLAVIYPQLGRPADDAVTGLAGIAGGHMLCGLSLRRGAVVATGTVAINICMIKVGGCPGVGDMAVVAVITARYVIGRFTQCNAVVVTGCTGTVDFSVVYPGHRRPERCAVASFTLRAAGDVAG